MQDLKELEELSEAEFDQRISEIQLPVLVDFSAPWCGPCQRMVPILWGFYKRHVDRVCLFKVDVGNCPNLASRYQIRTVPTLALFMGGKLVSKRIGTCGEAELIEFVFAIPPGSGG